MASGRGIGSSGRRHLPRHYPALPAANRDWGRRLADGGETPVRASPTKSGRARLPPVRGADGHRAGGAWRGGRRPRGARPGAAAFREVTAAGLSETLQRLLFLCVDWDETRQPAQGEDLFQGRADLAQDQSPADLFQLAMSCHQLAEQGGGHPLDPAEVQDELAAAGVLRQSEQLLAGRLDRLLLKDAASREPRYRDIADCFDFQPMPV